MKSIISVALALLFSLILIRISTTTAASHCSESANFTRGSTYAKNLKLLLSSLPSNTSTANGLFYNTTAGQGPNRIYIASLCRADSSTEDCSSCVNTTIQEMTDNCPNRIQAYSWQGDPPCIVQYSNRSFWGQLQLSPTDQGYNTANITTNMEQFDQTWEGLMARVLTRASTGSNSTFKFATGNVNLSLFQKIYTIMQCTPDLRQSDCQECLREVVSSYQSCCHGKQGGYVHKPSCLFRWDLYPFYDSSLDVPSPAPSPLPALPTPPPNLPPKESESGKKRSSSPTAIILIAVITSIIIVALVAFFCFLIRTRKPKVEEAGEAEVDEIINVESLRLDFESVRAATNDFSDDNKLGQGGFGTVYKGQLSNGQLVAVKRLSMSSGQGELEFKNEVLLVARLEHRNLVRLLGFCFQGQERLLIYELVKNSSLDRYIFDPTEGRILDWGSRYKIIRGIARGLLYLHEDSRLRIIHRDLKASNILLDEEMNPKISDFGMARLFAVDQTQQDTNRIVGTFGYMPPEYLRHGKFSAKSDVYSFGVLILEMISGQKNSSFSGADGESLLAYAWKNWREGRAANLIDESLRDGSRSEIMRCMHIGLLCVQENVGDRPSMASVDLMLSSHSVTLNVPSRIDAHSFQAPKSDSDSGHQSSVNEVSITDLYPR